MNRHDITDWVVHFIHDRNPACDPLLFSHYEDEAPIQIPDSFDYKGEPIYLTEQFVEDEYGLGYDANAFQVLKKIMYDGFIRAGWSFRNGNPTIYGPKSAVCFTEMPLYALLEYSKNRSNPNLVESYSIAFLKNELFEAGARPVIYGLSGKHNETKENDCIGLRCLEADSGIGLQEMYRYVYTNINSEKTIDWTHEREWRWANIYEDVYFHGLPFFVKNDIINFTKIIIIVKTDEEVVNLCEYILHLYHSKTASYGNTYNLEVLANTCFLSLEALSQINKDIDILKLDDLPLRTIPKLKKIKVSTSTIDKVKNAIQRASIISYDESERKYKEIGDVGGCGWTNVVTYASNSEITQALINLELATSYGTGYYVVSLDKSFPAQSLEIDEAGKIKAAEFLTKELNQSFSTHWEWD